MGKKAKISVKPEDFDRTKLARLQKLVDYKRNDLDWHHAVGQLVEELLPDRVYGEGRMEGLVDLLNRNGKKVSVTLLKTAREFTSKYPDSERDLPTLQGLSFAHVSRLITIKDHNRRDSYRQQCQKLKWSSRELGTKIHEEFDKRSKGGRTVQKVTRVGSRTALRKVVWLRKVPFKQCMKMLKQNQRRLVKRMSRQPDDKLVSLVGDACSALDEMLDALTDVRTKLLQAKSARKVPNR